MNSKVSNSIIFLYKFKVTKLLLRLAAKIFPKLSQKLNLFDETIELLKLSAKLTPVEYEKINNRKKIDQKYWTQKRVNEAIQALSSPLARTFHMDLLLTCRELSKYNDIIDFGAGTGLQSIQLRKAFPNTKITMYDTLYNSGTLIDEPLKTIMDKNGIEICRDLSTILNAKKKLIYSNGVFSWMPLPMLKKVLNAFAENKCDILMMANTLLPQVRTGKVSDFRAVNEYKFDHNYYAVFQELDFDIEWMYQLDQTDKEDKTMVFLFAKAVSQSNLK